MPNPALANLIFCNGLGSFESGRESVGMHIGLRLWYYWTANFKTAKDWYNMTVLVSSGVFFVIGLAGYFISLGDLKDFAGFFASVFGVIFAVVAFLWLPFKRHEESERKHADEMASVISKRDAARVEIMTQLGNLLLDVDGMVSELRSKVNLPYTEESEKKYFKTLDAVSGFFMQRFGRDEVALYFNNQTHHEFSDALYRGLRGQSLIHAIESLQQTSKYLVKFMEKEKTNPTPLFLGETKSALPEFVIE